MSGKVDRRAVYADLGWRHGLVPAAIVGLAIIVVTALAGADAVWARFAPALAIAGIILAAMMPVAMLAMMRHEWTGALALGIVAGLFVVNLLGLGLPRIGWFSELSWNWQGKTLDLVWCLTLIALLNGEQRREIGWTLTTRPGTLPEAFINIGILTLVGFLMFGGFSPAAYSTDLSSALTLERVLFDTAHPNLVEEIVFRGFMLALLDRAFPPRWTLWKAQIGWGLVLVTLLFGLVHGVSLASEGGIVLDPFWFAASAAAGFVIGWIRALTGSLWPAFLAHCAPEIGILFALALR